MGGPQENFFQVLSQDEGRICSKKTHYRYNLRGGKTTKNNEGKEKSVFKVIPWWDTGGKEKKNKNEIVWRRGKKKRTSRGARVGRVNCKNHGMESAIRQGSKNWAQTEIGFDGSALLKNSTQTTRAINYRKGKKGGKKWECVCVHQDKARPPLVGRK